MSIAKENRLGSCLSPYLRQHASNPVHWQPWDDEALRLAHEHNVPILLSIGYAACHWCHVMEDESFADDKMAALMNDKFVCIKVDREERPDLDKTYQAAHYLLSRQNGGWPLTVFLAPDLVPFFTGTYFPPVARRNMLSFGEVLTRVRHVWDERWSEVEEQNKVIAKSLRELDARQAKDRVPAISVLVRTNEDLLTDFDPVHGGLGKAPKFPQSPALLYVMHVCMAGETQLREGLVKTLDVMASGGLHDHVGGGFFRYCVDPIWDIPHFEKMHYDNALLLDLYAHAAIQFDQPGYAYVAERTAAWMLEDLRTQDGGFVAAWDADSEGEEGKYYVWSDEELSQVLDGSQRRILAGHLNLAGPPNFEGAYHLHQPEDRGFVQPSSEVEKLLELLRLARKQRVAPFIDDKVLASSCGLAAHALARAGIMLDKPAWVDAARAAVRFVTTKMFVSKHLRIAWRQGELSEVPAFLDDHAYLLQARLALLAADCTVADVEAATNLADAIIDKFDDGEGGLLFTSKEGVHVLRHIRSCDDGPIPAGNGIMARCLLQLGWLLGREDYMGVAQQIFEGFCLPLEQAPVHAPTLSLSLECWYSPPAIVVLTGDHEAVRQWAGKLLRAKGPSKMVLPVGDSSGFPAGLAKPMPPAGIAVWAHVCRGNTCWEPVADFDQLCDTLSVTAHSKGRKGG